MKQLKITAASFLAEYWQKKPTIIRNAFDVTTDILDEHELAGLAMEEEIDSRIISFNENQWQNNCGPFEDFTPLCQGQWTLLVQGVENYLRDAQDLLDEFDFIPGWRRDDLMVSFSVAGAGVGPHLDQYDVFIIQGKGSRRWQVGLPGDYQEISPHPKLRQITEFKPVLDEVLYPGDIVYIPPGHPHNGVALEDCLNYSVGFRASTQTELLNSFCDFLMDNDYQGLRYTDPELKTRSHSSEISLEEIDKFREQISAMLHSEQFSSWLGCHLSDAPKCLPEEPETDVSATEVLKWIEQGYAFEKCPGVHTLSYAITTDSEALKAFINSDEYAYPVTDQEEVHLLLNSTVWRPKSKNNFKNSSQFIHNLSTLINKGLWIVQSD
ncbi:cupin domain-containing protein [Planctobacterium marinum]|uniref:50S ribosomal protein L16 arginine hydroxylase n=1 Tax=Planctobacterium marinum TaxID=1631968 RepID=A0AA48KS61_9ALTE|nr:50S ribosomal protein L16 arginine hydroxylase [Planctobacterium marinum]